jgi:enoyl-CoA hydratase/carnithine racemase
MTGPVRLEISDEVATIVLDRPPANAIDLDMALALQDTIRAAGDRDDVGALVLWGGRRLFAAGADIRAMADWGPDEVRPSVSALADACDLLEETPKISVAAINGFALGGGLELAMACDLRVVAYDAQLGQPEIKLGVIPGAGGTQRLVPLVGAGRARDIVYSGRIVEAEEARAIGLVQAVVPPDDAYAEAVALARSLARGPRRALAAAKEAIQAAVHSPGRQGIDRERELFVGLFGTSDQREGMRAFLDKREPRFGESS